MRSEKDIAFYEFDGFRLVSSSRQLLYADKSVFLAPKVFNLLLLLAQNSGQVLTKETIMHHLWSGQFVEDNNLTVTMSKLRKILGKGGGGNAYVESIPGIGYRFVPEVQKIYDSTAKSEGKDESFLSLAILPFINVNDDANLEYLCDGVTESLINNLSSLPIVRIIARNAVFRFKGREFDLQLIGQKLNIKAVLIGRIYEFGESLTLSVELVDVSDQTQMWGKRYLYKLSDVTVLQGEIAKEVSEEVSNKLKSALIEGEKNSLPRNWR